MAFNPDTSTSLVTSFKGSTTVVDPYDVDSSHGLWSQNTDFILGQNESIQAATRRGTSQVAQVPNGDGPIATLDSWYFNQNKIEDCFAVYYAPAVGIKAWNQLAQAFTTAYIPITGATLASSVFDGLRQYVAFVDATGRQGFDAGQVYGFPIGADKLFPAPLQTTIANPVITQPSAGVITAGSHRLAFIFTSRNGYVSALNPVNASGVFAPVTFTAADGVHNCQVAIAWASIPSYLNPGGTVQIAMSSAANPFRIFLVAGAIGVVPPAPATTTITFSISDNDLVEGTEVTLNQNFLVTSQAGAAPFLPSALFTYSSRLGYCTFDSSGFPVVYISDQNSYQSVTAALNGIYIEGRQIPIQGASLGGSCYIGTLSGLYACQDNGDSPVTWTPPARIDGSVGILCSTCMKSAGGRILLASEKGLYVFRGGAFPKIPLSYFQADWQRINWTRPWQIQIADDEFDKVLRVQAPLKVVITGVSNTNPISITTAVLINGKPVAYPHFFQTGMSVTISGVSGNTAANTTQNITVTSDNTFTIPVAGNGAYTPGADGFSGSAAPNTPNTIMTWNYSEADEPGIALYSLNAFASYHLGAMGIIHNISTQTDETWYAPSSNNPGGLLRRVLPIDNLPLHRDQNPSGAAAAINSNYETSLLPGSQDEQATIHDSHGMHTKVSGTGSMAVTVYGVDHVRSVIPLASPLTLAGAPGKEILVKWFLRSEQASVAFGTNAVDAYFVMALIRYYYTNSLMQR